MFSKFIGQEIKAFIKYALLPCRIVVVLVSESKWPKVTT